MKKQLYIFIIILPFCIYSNTLGQDLNLPEGFPSFDIEHSDDPEPGYYFVCPQPVTGLSPGYLIITDNYGVPVFYRETAMKTYCFQPYPNGNLAYFEGSVRKYVMLDGDYHPIDTMGCQDCDRFDLHEIRILENGHYLLMGKKFRTVDMSLVIEGGDPEATIEDYLVQEFDPHGNLVFEWATRPHYEIADLNSAVDLTISSIDVTNLNAIEVESDTSLLLSMAHQDEITKIDRRTGEVIWRLGGRNNQFKMINSTRPFTRQHDVRRLPNGNITVFDNGTFSDPGYARAVEYEIDENAMTVTQVWEFDHDKTVSSSHKGNVQRLPGGNTLIGWGDYQDNPAVPAFTEVKPDGSIALEVSFPEHDGSYRVVKYPWKTTLFTTNTDHVNFGEWDGYTSSVYILKVKNNSDRELKLSGYHVHTNAFSIDQETFPSTLSPGEEKNIIVSYYPYDIDNSHVEDVLTIYSDINSDTLIQRTAVQVNLRGTKMYSDVHDAETSLFRISPNPAREFIHVSTPGQSDCNVEVYSSGGLLISSTSTRKPVTTIQTGALEKGTYIVIIRDQQNTIIYANKLVIE